MSTSTTNSAEPRRRQARAEATRTALLDAALQEFAAHGFEGASTRTIAARAGTHQPQINYHFDSKDALWRAAVDHLFGRLDRIQGERLAAAPPATTPRARFAAGLDAFVHAAADLPELNRIMIQESTADSERLDWIVAHHVQHRYDGIVSQWRELRDAGQARPIDDAVFYYSIVGAASLAYVSGPEARRLGTDIRRPGFVEAHVSALLQMFLTDEPDGGSR